MDKELKEILKQVNRRLINAESSIRVVEQRIDVLEGGIEAIERKTGRNTKDLSELSSAGDDLEGLRGDVIKQSSTIDGLASKSDVDAVKKYLDLIAAPGRADKE